MFLDFAYAWRTVVCEGETEGPAEALPQQIQGEVLPESVSLSKRICIVSNKNSLQWLERKLLPKS